MQKWEYRFVIVEKYGKGIFGFVLPSDISWKVRYVNGKTVQNWTDVTLYNYLEEVGKQGWELVSMAPHMNIKSGTLPEDQLYLVLKKPSE